jgi:hypothetical protein
MLAGGRRPVMPPAGHCLGPRPCDHRVNAGAPRGAPVIGRSAPSRMISFKFNPII